MAAPQDGGHVGWAVAAGLDLAVLGATTLWAVPAEAGRPHVPADPPADGIAQGGLAAGVCLQGLPVAGEVEPVVHTLPDRTLEGLKKIKRLGGKLVGGVGLDNVW